MCILAGVTIQWKPIPGYENRYEVSNTGRVSSLLRNIELAQMTDRKGHLRVTLYGTGTKQTLRVHVLVLQAFVGPRPAGAEVCHFDDVKSNNRLSNLSWGDASQNAFDRVRNGLHNQARKTHCPQNHLYDDLNTGYNKRNGGYSRYCKRCRREGRKRRGQKS